MKPFDTGDIVRLKSGSPRLTVYGIDNDGRVRVNWIGYNSHEPHSAVFWPEMLRLESKVSQ